MVWYLCLSPLALYIDVVIVVSSVGFVIWFDKLGVVLWLGNVGYVIVVWYLLFW